MKLFSWIRFEWDLSGFSDVDLIVPDHYQIARATKDDEKEVRKVFSSAFLLDPSWNPAISLTMQTIQPWLDQAFGPETSETRICLALRHGLRVIGASVVAIDPAADNHLVPGPCVLTEYRNRGFGTALLRSSLKLLIEAGLSRAFAMTRENAPVTKFLYPKFGGSAIAADSDGLLAA